MAGPPNSGGTTSTTTPSYDISLPDGSIVHQNEFELENGGIVIRRDRDYPDGRQSTDTTTIDPDSGNVTHEHREYPAEIGSETPTTEGKVVTDKDGNVIDREGDTGFFEDDPIPPDNEETKPESPKEPEKDETPTDEDPECTDGNCSGEEPSIWDDLWQFGIGVLEGLNPIPLDWTSAAILAVGVGLAVFAAPWVSIAFGVGLLAYSAYQLYENWDELSEGERARGIGGIVGGVLPGGPVLVPDAPKRPHIDPPHPPKEPPLPPPKVPPPSSPPKEPPPQNEPSQPPPPRDGQPSEPPPKPDDGDGPVPPVTPKVDSDHIFKGNPDKRNGYHSRPDGVDSPGVKIGDPIEGPDVNGVYEAKVWFEKPPGSGEYVSKKGNGGKSTFFPDSWSKTKVLESIKEAYSNARQSGNIGSDGFWWGELPNGMRIEGWLKKPNLDVIDTAYPKMKQ